MTKAGGIDALSTPSLGAGSQGADELHRDSQRPVNRPSVSLSVPLWFAVVMWILALLPDRPWTFYGHFERIRLGMSKAQVRSVMGRVGNDSPPWDNVPTYVEGWEVFEGRPRSFVNESPHWKVYWADFGDERWSSNKASILITYSTADLVETKAWLEERGPWSRAILYFRAKWSELWRSAMRSAQAGGNTP